MADAGSSMKRDKNIELAPESVEVNEGVPEKESDLIYSLNDVPPWYMCILFAFQHCFLSLGGSIGAPLIIADAICIPKDSSGETAKAYLVGSVLVVNGICSFIQATFGTRLPILQGSSFAFLLPAFSIMNLPRNQCPSALNATTAATLGLTPGVTFYDELTADGTYATGDDVWMRRITELQGALVIASVFEVLIGFTGLVGFLTKLFGPLTITTTISLIGISLVEVTPNHAKYQWGIAFFTAFVLVVTSQYMKEVKVPFPGYSRSKSFHKVHSQPFKLFPVLIAIFLGWILCHILTVAGCFSDDPDDFTYMARSDAKFDNVYSSPWFRFPYPGQWGLPIVRISGVIGMLSAVMASVIESIGDYNACASMCQSPPLPKHAVNRGIMMEGLGCMLAGLVGTTTGTTSYSENIAAIGITKVASRRVMQWAGVLSLLIGCFTKIGAFLVSIPEPVFGGIFMVVFGMVIAIGLTNLRFVDLTSNRNVFVIGFSFYMGLMIPYCVKQKFIVIETGVPELNQTILVLLESSLTVGAFVAALIDNTLPGTSEERGMGKEDRSEAETVEQKRKQALYFNPPIRDCCGISKYLPILPTESHILGSSTSPEVNVERVDETAFGGQNAPPPAYPNLAYTE